MNNKTILMITFGMIFLAGVVAANSLYNVSDTMTVSTPNVIGGDSFTANFSFYYFDIPGNYNNSALVIKLNVTSWNQSSYPVEKGDFKVSGYTKKCTYVILGLCLLPKKTYFSCSEENQTLINSTIYGPNTVDAPKGIFYCFNDSNSLSLNEHDNVFLNITPNIALWPGNYTLNATLFYLNDTLAPWVNITNKADFDRYYKPGEYLEINANISDNVGLSDEYGAIYDGNTRYLMSSSGVQNGLYYFTDNSIPTNLSEGDYPLTITAIDTSGNVGNDTVILKLDETGPVIKVLQPTNGTVVSDKLPIELNVTDAKSGVNQSSVQFELAAINSAGQICPDKGIGINYSCYNSGWINIPYNSSTGTYLYDANVTNASSGSYWLDARAYDNLGNLGEI